MTRPLRKNLKKQVKLIIFFQMKRERQIMISLVMLHLKVQVEAAKVLGGLILHLFQIFLKIFLATLVAEVPQEEQVIVEMI